MPPGVAVDGTAVRALSDRMRRIGEDIMAVTITDVTDVPGVPGSALAGVTGPHRAAAEMRRLGYAVQDWATAAEGFVAGLGAVDLRNRDNLG